MITDTERIFEVSGTPYECGFQQGRAFRSHRPRFVNSMRDYPHLPKFIRPLVRPSLIKGWLSFRGQRIRKKVEPLIADYFDGAWRDRLQGLADGFQVSLSEVYGYNSVEFMTANIHTMVGCASFAFNEQETGGEPVLAYNHDYIPAFEPFFFIRKNALVGCYASLSLAYEPVIGAIGGLNEKGLAISLNHGYATDRVKEGVPMAFLVQSCLDTCATTREALNLIERIPVACGGLMTVIDEAGDRAVFELAPSRRAIRETECGPLYSFNAYQTDVLKPVEISQEARFPHWTYPTSLRGLNFHEFNWRREERYQALVSKEEKVWTVDRIRSLLSDHGPENKPGRTTICRHHPETAVTVASAMLYPKRKSVEVSFGQPCAKEYRVFSL